MGFYLAFFWVFFLISLVSAIFVFFVRINRKTKDSIYNLYFFTMIMMGLFLFLAIATKDPFLEILPIFDAIKQSGWEIALSVVIFGVALFGSWIYLKKEYLKPLRDHVGKLQEEVPRIDERTKQMDKKLDIILNKAKIKF